MDRKYNYEYVLMFGGGPIFYSSKNQVSIALSLVEVEYRGVVNAYIQTVWMQGILLEFEIGSDLSTVLFCDD